MADISHLSLRDFLVLVGGLCPFTDRSDSRDPGPVESAERGTQTGLVNLDSLSESEPVTVFKDIGTQTCLADINSSASTELTRETTREQGAGKSPSAYHPR